MSGSWGLGKGQLTEAWECSLFREPVLFWEKHEFISWRNFVSVCLNVLVASSQNIRARILIWKHSGRKWYLKLWWCWDSLVTADKTPGKGRLWALGKATFRDSQRKWVSKGRLRTSTRRADRQWLSSHGRWFRKERGSVKWKPQRRLCQGVTDSHVGLAVWQTLWVFSKAGIWKERSRGQIVISWRKFGGEKVMSYNLIEELSCNFIKKTFSMEAAWNVDRGL